MYYHPREVAKQIGITNSNYLSYPYLIRKAYLSKIGFKSKEFIRTFLLKEKSSNLKHFAVDYSWLLPSEIRVVMSRMTLEETQKVFDNFQFDHYCAKRILGKCKKEYLPAMISCINNIVNSLVAQDYLTEIEKLLKEEAK